MYKYSIEILGRGCEVAAGELSPEEILRLEHISTKYNVSISEVLQIPKLLKECNIGISEWYELDDICHIYGSYPSRSRVKVIGETTNVYDPTKMKTLVDDFYSLTEFDSINTKIEEKGVLIQSELVTKHPFDIELLTLLITKIEDKNKDFYLVTGFIYGNEYLTLKSVDTTQISIVSNVNKVTDNILID